MLNRTYEKILLNPYREQLSMQKVKFAIMKNLININSRNPEYKRIPKFENFTENENKMKELKMHYKTLKSLKD